MKKREGNKTGRSQHTFITMPQTERTFRRKPSEWRTQVKKATLLTTTSEREGAGKMQPNKNSPRAHGCDDKQCAESTMTKTEQWYSKTMLIQMSWRQKPGCNTAGSQHLYFDTAFPTTNFWTPVLFFQAEIAVNKSHILFHDATTTCKKTLTLSTQRSLKAVSKVLYHQKWICRQTFMNKRSIIFLTPIPPSPYLDLAHAVHATRTVRILLNTNSNMLAELDSSREPYGCKSTYWPLITHQCFKLH